MMYRFPERERAREQMLKTNDADDKYTTKKQLRTT